MNAKKMYSEPWREARWNMRINRVKRGNSPTEATVQQVQAIQGMRCHGAATLLVAARWRSTLRGWQGMEAGGTAVSRQVHNAAATMQPADGYPAEVASKLHPRARVIASLHTF